MKISARIDYACRALLELSLHWPSPYPLQVTEIAERQKIPAKFLVHILIDLKQQGLVDSVRGQKGGYVLAKTPGDISLCRVIENFAEFTRSKRAANSKFGPQTVFDAIWEEANEEMLKKLEKVTFEEICRRERNTAKVPMYTI